MTIKAYVCVCSRPAPGAGAAAVPDLTVPHAAEPPAHLPLRDHQARAQGPHPPPPHPAQDQGLPALQPVLHRGVLVTADRTLGSGSTRRGEARNRKSRQWRNTAAKIPGTGPERVLHGGVLVASVRLPGVLKPCSTGLVLSSIRCCSIVPPVWVVLAEKEPGVE
jgi:hypothetical protein